MAFSDRPYYSNDDANASKRSPLGQLQLWSVNTWIIVLNVAVFVIDAVIWRTTGTTWLTDLGYFSADTAIHGGQVWRFITFQFLHAGIGHIFFNMLWLYFFGRFIEQYLGSRRYLAFYLLCGIAGPVFYMLFWAMGMIVSGPGVPLVGASAGVFGVIAAMAIVAPNARVMLLFPPIPIRIKTLAYIALGIAAFTVLIYGHTPGANAGGEAAHLGGAAMGFVLIKRARWLNAVANLRLPSPARAIRQSAEHRRDARTRSSEEEIDRILRKVHEQGLASLTEKEKRTLRQATESKRAG